MLKGSCYESAQELIGVCGHLVCAEAFLEDQALRDTPPFSLAAGMSEIIKDMLATGYDSPAETSRPQI